MATQLIVFVLAIATAFALYKLFPEETKTAVRALDVTRTTVFFVGGVLFALVFIGSGNRLLIFVGFMILVYLAVKGLTDYDRSDVERVFKMVKP